MPFDAVRQAFEPNGPLWARTRHHTSGAEVEPPELRDERPQQAFRSKRVILQLHRSYAAVRQALQGSNRALAAANALYQGLILGKVDRHDRR